MVKVYIAFLFDLDWRVSATWGFEGEAPEEMSPSSFSNPVGLLYVVFQTCGQELHELFSFLSYHAPASHNRCLRLVGCAETQALVEEGR
jgi:hypothetical protein